MSDFINLATLFGKQQRVYFVSSKYCSCCSSHAGPALPLGQLGSPLERSLEGTQNPLFSWFPVPNVFVWSVTGT